MLNFISRFFTICTLMLIGCAATLNNNEKLVGYDLNKPDRRYELPSILHEISGVTIIDSNTFACIQDENGILFIYDAKNNQIKKQYKFNIDGDYEGIARVRETMYVLRSDGTIFEINNYASDDFRLNSYDTGIPADNNEGLCYDADNDRLLIACKSKIGKGPENKDKRAIYAFSLQTKKLSSNPVFEFDVQQIKEFAMNKNLNLPLKTRKKNGQAYSEPFIRFGTSAICIHPLSKKLFLLSATDHLLFTFNMDGKIEHMQQLDPDVFNKSEGIAFYDNGDMIITNEGQDAKPTFLHFDYYGSN